MLIECFIFKFNQFVERPGLFIWEVGYNALATLPAKALSTHCRMKQPEIYTAPSLLLHRFRAEKVVNPAAAGAGKFAR